MITKHSAFYDQFERHAGGAGLKGVSTHYCPGCGHGLAHKYLAEAITELEIADRTVAVSPVGCSVFLYYYLDVGNTQAAHGRAPAVAIGHKLANPESIVISYQGDGDLASIGLAEIVHAAQVGIPISVVFINNAIYGMTGGQMAPTTLPGQKSATTPTGRGLLEGAPLRVSEMIAGFERPVYVERVALFDQKHRKRAKAAIKKALRLQVEGKGFSFVEVLAECPTHLKMTPTEAERWVEESMVPQFPLGVLKDVETEPWFHLDKPRHDPQEMLNLIQAEPYEEVHADPERFPKHLHPEDVAVKFAGAGGDGAQTAALLITKAAIEIGFDATHIPSYGPESRGGTSYADVHVALNEVISPASPHPHVLVAFNAPSLEKFGKEVQPGGYVVYDTSVINECPKLPDGVTAVGVPFAQIALDLGHRVVKNVVALGALVEATKLLDEQAVLSMIRKALAKDCARLPVNEEAFAWGQKCVREGITHLEPA